MSVSQASTRVGYRERYTNMAQLSSRKPKSKTAQKKPKKSTNQNKRRTTDLSLY